MLCAMLRELRHVSICGLPGMLRKDWAVLPQLRGLLQGEIIGLHLNQYYNMPI